MSTGSEMKWHMFRRGSLGWFNDDRGLQSLIGGGDETLTYEHYYDAARSYAIDYECDVELRDSAGLPCVRFAMGTGNVIFTKSMSDEEF